LTMVRSPPKKGRRMGSGKGYERRCERTLEIFIGRRIAWAERDARVRRASAQRGGAESAEEHGEKANAGSPPRR
jgi:hypothetical protein